MKLDIVPIKGKYKGICRTLTPNDFLTFETKDNYDTLISLYFEYIDLTCSPNKIYDSQVMFDSMVKYYKKFLDYGVECEFIAYGDAPIENVFGYSAKFLGIDVVHDLCESLLADSGVHNTSIDYLLNSNGLCENQINVQEIIKKSISGDVKWKACWVYKIAILTNRFSHTQDNIKTGDGSPEYKE